MLSTKNVILPPLFFFLGVGVGSSFSRLVGPFRLRVGPANSPPREERKGHDFHYYHNYNHNLNYNYNLFTKTELLY